MWVAWRRNDPCMAASELALRIEAAALATGDRPVTILWDQRYTLLWGIVCQSVPSDSRHTYKVVLGNTNQPIRDALGK